MSFLSCVGKDFKAVFTWIASPKGQAVIGAGEGIVEAVAPSLTGVINLANTWMTEIIKTQALGEAAGAGVVSNTGKAAATINAVTPELLSFLQKYKLPTMTSDKIQAANDALVSFLNALGEPSLPTTTPTTSIAPLTGAAAPKS